MVTIVNENQCIWQPQEIVDLGNDCQCGITVDDHCFVVLTLDAHEQWQSVKHIPKAVALKLGELVNQGKLDY